MSARPDAGFALILALLSLVLLTFLGLTLATTSSSELQIASNYRWGQQALYNAEAGIEAGKIILRNIGGNWGSVLPAQRGGSWSYGSPPNPSAAPSIGATRNYENRHELSPDCDHTTGVGYGAVLDDTQATPLLMGQAPAGPYENVTTFKGMTLKGSFTLWVRRDLKIDSDTHSSTEGQYSDSPDNKVLILLSEGSAPGLGTALGAAVRVLQVRLARGDQDNTSCSAAEGQTGIAASGANFGACAPLNPASVVGLVTPGGGGGGDTGAK